MFLSHTSLFMIDFMFTMIVYAGTETFYRIAIKLHFNKFFVKIVIKKRKYFSETVSIFKVDIAENNINYIEHD